MNKRYVTVVFEVNDDKKFKEDLPDLAKKMLFPETAPWRVTAMSLDDEMTRLNIIESALRNRVYDIGVGDLGHVINDIANATEIHSKKLSDFL